MPRIRSIKPEFAKDETLAELPRDVRLHYALLWTYADDEGRGVDNPRLIKAELWPLDDDVTAETVDGWQQELADAGRIVRYKVDGRRYFATPRWSAHQHPQKKSESKIPAPPDPGHCADHEPDSNSTRPLRGDSANGHVALSPVVVGEKEKEGSSLAPPPADAGEPKREPKRRRPSTPVQLTDETPARRVAKQHWEATEPRPAVKFIALVKVCERFIDAGWSESNLLAALGATRAYTVDAIEYTLRETNSRRAGPDRTGVEAFVARVRASGGTG